MKTTEIAPLPQPRYADCRFQDSNGQRYEIYRIWDEGGNHMTSSRHPERPMRRYRLIKIWAIDNPEARA